MRIRINSLVEPFIMPNRESGDKRFVLAMDYSFTLLIDNAHRKFTIAKGFQYDGASVPRIGMFLIGLERFGVHNAAALIHDYMYVNNGKIIDSKSHLFTYTRKDADIVFLKAMEYHGVKSWHARVAYLAVRGFGWIKRSF